MIRKALTANHKITVAPYEGQDANFPYPNPSVTPKEKASKAYALKQANAIYYEFINNQLSLPFTWATDEGGVMDIPTLRAYADNNQPVSKYQKMMGYQKNPDNAQASRKAKQQISWSIKSPCRRYIDGIKGAMSSIKHAILIQAVDKYSQELLAEKKYRMLALKKNEKYHEINQRLNVKSPMPIVRFGDEEELDIIMKTDQRFQQSHAIALKQVLMYSMDELSNFPEIEDALLEDLVVCGWACAHASVDNLTNKVIAKYIDVETLLVPNSQNKNYEDIDRAGHIRLLTFSDLCREAKKAPDGGPSFEELCKIAAMYSGGRYSVDQVQNILNTAQNGVGTVYAGSLVDRILIPVLFHEYKEWNAEKRIYRERSGNGVFSKKVATDYKVQGSNEKVLNTEHECWYKGKWVIGTDIMIDWGQVPYTETRSGGKTACRYKVYKSSKKSIVSQMIPTLDAKQILWLKYQDAWIKSRPPGMDINVTALMGVTDKEGNIIHPSEIIKSKVSTGIGMYAQTYNRNDPRHGTQGKPFEYDEGSVGLIVEKFAESDAKLDADLTTVSGITENMVGSEAKPNQLVRVTEMLIAGTHNRLQPIYNGVFQIKKETVSSMACQIQALAIHLPKSEPFYPEISDLKLQALRIGRDALKFKFGVVIKIIASDQMKQVITAAIAEQQAKGIMNASDALRVMGMIENGYYEEAERYLEYKEKKAAEMAAEAEQANMKMNQQAQESSIMLNAKAKADQLAQEGETKAMLEKLNANLQILIDNNKASNQMKVDDNKMRHEKEMQSRDLSVDREALQVQKEVAEKKKESAAV